MSTSKLNRLDGLIWRVSTLASRIKEAFGDAKPSEIARATKRSKGAVTQWLDGTTKSLKGETATMMEAATGYRAAWIVSGKGPRKVTDMAEVPTPEEMSLLIDFRALLAEDQAELTAEVRTRARKARAHVAKAMRELGLTGMPVSDAHVERHYPPPPPPPVHTMREPTRTPK